MPGIVWRTNCFNTSDELKRSEENSPGDQWPASRIMMVVDVGNASTGTMPTSSGDVKGAPMTSMPEGAATSSSQLRAEADTASELAYLHHLIGSGLGSQMQGPRNNVHQRPTPAIRVHVTVRLKSGGAWLPQYPVDATWRCRVLLDESATRERRIALVAAVTIARPRFCLHMHTRGAHRAGNRHFISVSHLGAAAAGTDRPIRPHCGRTGGSCCRQHAARHCDCKQQRTSCARPHHGNYTLQPHGSRKRMSPAPSYG